MCVYLLRYLFALTFLVTQIVEVDKAIFFLYSCWQVPQNKQYSVCEASLSVRRQHSRLRLSDVTSVMALSPSKANRLYVILAANVYCTYSQAKVRGRIAFISNELIYSSEIFLLRLNQRCNN